MRIDILEDPSAYSIRETRISQILVSLMVEALAISEKSVLIRAMWRKIPEDCILHSHRRENLKSYIFS
jgi:hypothetical protein